MQPERIVSAANLAGSSGWLAYSIGSVSLSWQSPVGGSAVDHYRVEWGTVISGAFGIFINSQNTAGTETSMNIVGLPTGTYAFQVIAVDANSNESAPTFLGTRVAP